MAHRCYRCGHDQGVIERVGRRDTCLACGTDLHCCRNCEFHDPSFHNQCRESQAERQVDKDRSNFCDYFQFRHDAASGKTSAPAGSARASLDALFRKRES
jgi:predicted  nucleic acid-binding Zn-ribbon protein